MTTTTARAALTAAFPDWDAEGLLGLVQMAAMGDLLDADIAQADEIVKPNYDEIISILENELL